jgi:ubiquinone/menaquinone biosynthesis C-methylase UbiE
MKWYDIFASFYDSSLEKLYRESRIRAVQMLDLQSGKTLLDVACGTGANFEHIVASNKSISVFGTDFSEGMLRKAAARVHANHWNGFQLFQADARELNPETIANFTSGTARFDRVLCVLGLSVIPGWEKVLENLIALLAPEGKLVVVDVFAEKRTWNTRLVEMVAKADLNRRIWQQMESRLGNFELAYIPAKESKVGGRLFVASGAKKP